MKTAIIYATKHGTTEKVAQAIKRARHIAIMPYVGDNLKDTK